MPSPGAPKSPSSGIAIDVSGAVVVLSVVGSLIKSLMVVRFLLLLQVQLAAPFPALIPPAEASRPVPS